jgi:hypothetical protein
VNDAPLNKVDVLVREMMLTYPTLYPSRPVALYSIFTDSGTNYVWNRKGCVVPAHKLTKDFDGPINISDLARMDAEWNRDDDFARTIRIENELERRERLYRAEHIDLLCKYGGRSDYGYHQLDNYLLDTFEGAYGVAMMFRAPAGKIDPVWAHALERFVGDMFVAFNQVYSLHFDKPLRDEKAPVPSMYSQMPPAMQRRYDNLRKLADRLEQQTGTRAKAKAFMEQRGAALIAEIKAKEDV